MARRGRPGAADGGLRSDGEDIEVLELPFTEALAMIHDGCIADTKTISIKKVLPYPLIAPLA